MATGVDLQTDASLTQIEALRKATHNSHGSIFAAVGAAALFGILPVNEIHRALADSWSSRSVSDVALEYGINHFGRFAASHRNLFSELPSETRRAARAR